MKRFLLWLSLLPVFLFGSSSCGVQATEVRAETKTETKTEEKVEEYTVVNKKFTLAGTNVVLEFKEDGYVYFVDNDNPWRRYEQEDDILKLAEINKDYYSEYYFIYNGKLIKIERYYTEVSEPETPEPEVPESEDSESINDKKD